jgi:hypothetical protein
MPCKRAAAKWPHSWMAMMPASTPRAEAIDCGPEKSIAPPAIYLIFVSAAASCSSSCSCQAAPNSSRRFLLVSPTHLVEKPLQLPTEQYSSLDASVQAARKPSPIFPWIDSCASVAVLRSPFSPKFLLMSSVSEFWLGECIRYQMVASTFAVHYQSLGTRLCHPVKKRLGHILGQHVLGRTTRDSLDLPVLKDAPAALKSRQCS